MIGRYLPLLAVALLDLSISVALLGSSVAFWQARSTTKPMSASIAQQDSSQL